MHYDRNDACIARNHFRHTGLPSDWQIIIYKPPTPKVHTIHTETISSHANSGSGKYYEGEKQSNMYHMRANPPPTLRDETKVMEEYCWVITDGRADKSRPICFQYSGCSDFNWTPFYIHSTSTDHTYTHYRLAKSRLAPDHPARNYCASQAMSVIFIKVTVLCQMPKIYIYIYI
jgi:hypothetical protein